MKIHGYPWVYFDIYGNPCICLTIWDVIGVKSSGSIIRGGADGAWTTNKNSSVRHSHEAMSRGRWIGECDRYESQSK